MNTEQIEYVTNTLTKMGEGNQVLLELLSKMAPADQVEYIPKVMACINNYEAMLIQAQQWHIKDLKQTA